MPNGAAFPPRFCLPALRRARLARRGPAPLVAAVSRADLSCSALVMSISAGVVTTGMPSATPAGNRASITGAPPVVAGAAAVRCGRFGQQIAQLAQAWPDWSGRCPRPAPAKATILLRALLVLTRQHPPRRSMALITLVDEYPAQRLRVIVSK